MYYGNRHQTIDEASLILSSGSQEGLVVLIGPFCGISVDLVARHDWF